MTSSRCRARRSPSRIAAGALARLDRRKLAECARGSAGGRREARRLRSRRRLFGPVRLGALWPDLQCEQGGGAAGGPRPRRGARCIDPRSSQRLADCGVATPNARDAMFVAAWRLMGVDPARLRPLDIRQAAVLMARARPTMQGFALADPVGALARGAICLTVGTPGEAAAANARAKTMGVHAANRLRRAEGRRRRRDRRLRHSARRAQSRHRLQADRLSADARNRAAENARAAGLTSSESCARRRADEAAVAARRLRRQLRSGDGNRMDASAHIEIDAGLRPDAQETPAPHVENAAEYR